LGQGGAETHVLSPEAGGKRRLMKTLKAVQGWLVKNGKENEVGVNKAICWCLLQKQWDLELNPKDHGKLFMSIKVGSSRIKMFC
jgi:hypothetical protein